MKRILIVVLFLLAVSGLHAQVTIDYRAEVLTITNRERATAGLPPLARNVNLDAAAQRFAEEMARTGVFSHTGEGGTSPWDRFATAGYVSWIGAGENIARGWGSPSAVMTAWMNSAGHRSNILGNFNEIGIGYAAQGSQWVQDFGRRANIEPPPLPPPPAPPPPPIPPPVPPPIPSPVPPPTPGGVCPPIYSGNLRITGYWFQGQRTSTVGIGATYIEGDLPLVYSARGDSVTHNGMWVSAGPIAPGIWAANFSTSGEVITAQPVMRSGTRTARGPPLTVDGSLRPMQGFLQRYQYTLASPALVQYLRPGAEFWIYVSTDDSHRIPVEEAVTAEWNGVTIPVLDPGRPSATNKLYRFRSKIPADVAPGLACVSLRRADGTRLWGPPLRVCAGN